MHTLIHCGACRQQMRLPPSYVGKKVQCPACANRFVAQVEEDLVDVEPVEQAEPAGRSDTRQPQPEPAAVELAGRPPATEAEVLWVEPAEAEPERRAGPLRLRKPPPIKVPKPGRWPAYLFVLAALPLGLPLLAAFATFNRTQDPTATLLIWTGAPSC
jgi:hypothetical protein